MVCNYFELILCCLARMCDVTTNISTTHMMHTWARFLWSKWRCALHTQTVLLWMLNDWDYLAILGIFPPRIHYSLQPSHIIYIYLYTLYYACRRLNELHFGSTALRIFAIAQKARVYYIKIRMCYKSVRGFKYSKIFMSFSILNILSI